VSGLEVFAPSTLLGAARQRFAAASRFLQGRRGFLPAGGSRRVTPGLVPGAASKATPSFGRLCPAPAGNRQRPAPASGLPSPPRFENPRAVLKYPRNASREIADFS